MRKKFREKEILDLVVKDFVSTGKPIGSEYIVENHKLNISPATVRNYMMKLEKQSYLKSPHTSAGRIPTEKALKWFIEENLDFQKISKETKKIYKKIKNLSKEKFSNRLKYKNLLRILSNYTNSCGILCFEKDDFFITGISNLIILKTEKDLIEYRNLLRCIDNELDKKFNKYYDKLKAHQILMLIGKFNPISEKYSLICSRSSIFKVDVVIALLSKFSADYIRNLQAMNFENYLKNYTPEIIFQDI